MMMDADVVAASPATVYRVLQAAGCFARWNRTESSKGQGFQQPLAPHEHWHVDISYVNVCGTFYYLTSVLDGCEPLSSSTGNCANRCARPTSRSCCSEHGKSSPTPHPRIITDNGPQFVARDFQEFIRLCGMTHVRTSPYYPQSNGKIERWHGTLKRDCLRPHVPLSLDGRAATRRRASSSITITCACTARSATSRRPISSPAAKRRSSPSAIASSPPRENAAHNSDDWPPLAQSPAANTSGTEKRVEGAWGRGASSPPIPETSAAQPLHSINTN